MVGFFCAKARRARSGLRELRAWPLPEHAVDDDVDLLVEERDQPGDLLALGQRSAVAPREVFLDAIARAHRPVLRAPFVGTVRDGLARDQEVEADVRLG